MFGNQSLLFFVSLCLSPSVPAGSTECSSIPCTSFVKLIGVHAIDRSHACRSGLRLPGHDALGAAGDTGVQHGGPVRASFAPWGAAVCATGLKSFCVPKEMLKSDPWLLL